MRQVKVEEIHALLKERTVVFEGRITQEEVERIKRLLLELVSRDTHTPIRL